MKRQGFLLGLFSVGGQVLLLRELVSSLNGDELFIGTALFGWMASVALGAYRGGKSVRPGNPDLLFIAGAILLPVMVATVKLSPLLVTSVSGEVVPFTTAIIISILSMFPIGIISGWLFPLITRRVIYPASGAVVTVYFYEGLGAFVGGIVITLMVAVGETTLVAAVTMSIVTVAGLLMTGHIIRQIVVVAGVLIYIFVGMDAVLAGDSLMGRFKHDPYIIKAYFDTPYGHQTILDRDGSLTLLTDNTIEATHPDNESAENHFLVPFIYRPEAKKSVYIGRADFMLHSFERGRLPNTVDAVDSRGERLSGYIKLRGKSAVDINWHVTDPVDYFSSKTGFEFYDMVIINSGLPDNYINSRYFTPRFLRSVKTKMADSSLLAIPLAYDTDRYLTPETEQALSIIYATLASEFANVAVWPGTTTIFLASNRIPLDLTYDEIIGRLYEHNLGGDYISDAYLFDRLSEMKVERLMSAISGSGIINTTQKPVLTHYQALHRAKVNPADRAVLSFILGNKYWLLVIPVGILLLFILSYKAGNRMRGNAAFLYFTAGVVSLSLELIVFYLYQSTAGSLYSELALLVGAFMFGLALGTYYSHKIGDRPLEYPALIILLVATLIFLSMYNRIDTDALLPFHLFFLFVIAIATGTLFVAATNLYYADEKRANRGTGYAWEIAGSSLGALLTLTILLPIIGLTWLLISLLAIIILAFAGSVMSDKPARAY